MRPTARIGLPSTGLLAVAALLAACGTATSSTGPPPATTPAAVSASPAHTAATASPTAVAGCATSALKAAVSTTPGGAAAGSTYYPLQFTNTSGSTCTLFGYPGVAFVTGPSGSLLGQAARRNPVKPAATVTLAPGQVAHATLQVADAGNYDPAQCVPVTAHWLQVYPPNQFSALFVPFTTQACSHKLPSGIGGQLSISVVQPGAS